MRVRFHKKIIRLLLLTFLIGICLFLGYYFFVKAQVVTVSITKSGYEPNILTISKYTRVRFVNKDTLFHLPASNPHTAHTSYPEFDSKKEIEPESSWEFVPKKVGTLRYHDHLLPHLTGKLIVTEQSLFRKLFNFLNPPQLEKEPEEKKQETPIAQVIAVAENEGSEEGWEYLISQKAVLNTPPEKLEITAYEVGKMLFEDYGVKGVKTCTSDFYFSCYNGLIDQAFEKNLDLLFEAEKMCRESEGEQTNSYASCIHGLGHGIARFYQIDELGKSLVTCESLPVSGQESCFDGVFMEFGRNADMSFYQTNKPLYPCNSLNTKYAYSCGRNQVSVMFNRIGMNLDEIVSECKKTRTLPLKHACYAAIGFQVAYANKDDPNSITRECNALFTSGDNVDCLTAAAGEIAFQQFGQGQESAKQICNSLTEDDKNACLRYIEHITSN